MTYQELARLLSQLPWGESGVPPPLADLLIPWRSEAQARRAAAHYGPQAPHSPP